MADWISVKDRLPDHKGFYLVCCDVWGTNIISVCSWTDNLGKNDEFDFYRKARAGWYEYDSEYGYFERTNITHWMPLPEPPKEEE